MAFEDRLVEYPNRYTLIDSTTEEELGTYDLVRAEGEETTEGTKLTAATLTEEINAMIDAKLAGLTIDASGNVEYRNLQGGTATIKMTAARQTKSVNVNFAQAFTKAPIVVATPYATSPIGTNWSVANVTTTGFTIYMYRTTRANVGFRWIAYGN